MASYSFKSSGKSIADVQTALSGSLIPVGIKTPLRLGSKDQGIFAMHYDLLDQIKDNFRNMILTNHGERLGTYDFGANLLPLTFELVNAEDFDSEAIARVQAAATKYMPFILLKSYESNAERFENQHTGKIVLAITFDVPIINVFDQRIDVILSVV